MRKSFIIKLICVSLLATIAIVYLLKLFGDKPTTASGDRQNQNVKNYSVIMNAETGVLVKIIGKGDTASTFFYDGNVFLLHI